MQGTAEELIARLRRNPDDMAAFQALRGLYHRQGDFPSLANLLEGWAARSHDAGGASQAFYEAGEIALGVLGDRVRAADLYEKALERNPAHFEASLRIERMSEEEGNHRRLLQLLEKRAEAMESVHADVRQRAALFHQIGELWQTRFQRADRAIHYYRKAFELDPSLVPAIYAAREIYRQAGNLKAAAALYDLEANAETDLARKIALLRELAHLRMERLGDLEGCIVSLKRALQLAPNDLTVMHQLATAHLRRSERAPDVSAAMSDRHRAADLLYEMAQHVPPDHAITYAEAALDAAPDHTDALALLEHLAGDLGREDVLPVRWVAFLQAAPDAPGALEMRRRLGHEYVAAGQLEDAVVCFEPLLEHGDPEAGEVLADLYGKLDRPQDVARALAVAIAGLLPERRVPKLRELIEVLVALGNRDEAAARARQILEIDPADPDALSFLEDDCRARGDFDELRTLMLGAARVPGMAVEARKQLLREVAVLSEEKLNDVDGAVSAWRGVVTLDPGDADARAALRRLLERAERWDDLVQFLERDALAATDPDTKADVYRQLALVHRERRNDVHRAIESLRLLRELKPYDVESRDELCGLFIDVGSYRDAVPLLRERIDATVLSSDRVPMLRQLASILGDRLSDDEAAFEACTRLLDEEPGDLEAIQRMEQIDERSGRADRLLQTLSYRAEVAPEPERAAIFARMGALADHELGDLERAAEYYSKAFDLAPKEVATLDALCSVYDRAERYRDLVAMLRARAALEDTTQGRAEYYRRIARILGDRVRNEEAAAEAWNEVLVAGEDEEALRYLVALSRKREETDRLEELLGRLALLVSVPEERRDLMVERAQLLAYKLDRKDEAIAVLRDVLTNVDGAHLAAMEELAELCDSIGDKPGLADALERQIAATDDPGLRVPVAERLANLYENDLNDRDGAIKALFVWADADLTDTEPQTRLVRLLELEGRTRDLVTALDSLAGIEQDDELVGELIRKAADLAYKQLKDVDGAWERLAPRVGDGDAVAEEALRAIARDATRGEALANLYTEVAQSAATPEEQARRWNDAARVYEDYLSDASRALEAQLRAFATDLDNPLYLDETDRLAIASAAWPRLAQVYDTLLRRAETPERKVELLLRHGRILANDANDPSGALDRILRACALAPADDEVLAHAEELAPRAGRAEELLVAYDRRRSALPDDAARVETILRAARLADGTLGDRARAVQYIAQAVSLVLRSLDLADLVEKTARELDATKPAPPPESVRRALVGIYQKIAEDSRGQSASAGATLLLRASHILADELGDAQGAFGVLRQAAALNAGDPSILDELEDLSTRSNLLPAFDTQLSKLIDEALDSSTAAELLRRRGRILHESLRRYDDAAEVYNQLLLIAPNDSEAFRRLRTCLRNAGRHQDILMAIDRELERTREGEARGALLKEAAQTWEDALKNRWEALDVWRKVHELLPDDEDAVQAIERLERARRDSMGDEDSVAMLARVQPDLSPLSPESEPPGLAPVTPGRKSGELPSLGPRAIPSAKIPSPSSPPASGSPAARGMPRPSRLARPAPKPQTQETPAAAAEPEAPVVVAQQPVVVVAPAPEIIIEQPGVEVTQELEELDALVEIEEEEAVPPPPPRPKSIPPPPPTFADASKKPAAPAAPGSSGGRTSSIPPPLPRRR